MTTSCKNGMDPPKSRECVRTGAAGACNRRSLGHHLLHPLILSPRALFYRTDCTRRSKFLTHALFSTIRSICKDARTTTYFFPMLYFYSTIVYNNKICFPEKNDSLIRIQSSVIFQNCVVQRISNPMIPVIYRTGPMIN